MFDLKGKKALVTGATGGLGQAMAEALHANGAQVVVTGTRKAVLEELAASLGDGAIAIAANLSEAEEVSDLARAALEAMEGHTPALVILDLMMPVMDGFQFLEEVRQRDAWQALPIIVLTAKDLSGEDRSRLTGNVEEVLQKGSYTRDELLRKVSSRVAAHVRANRGESRGAADGQDPPG